MSAQKNFESFKNFLFEKGYPFTECQEDEGRKKGIRVETYYDGRYWSVSHYIFPFHFSQKGLKGIKKLEIHKEWKEGQHALRELKKVVRKL